MRALVVDSSGTLSLRDVPIPAGEGEALIRVRAAGICGTDLQILDGYAGFEGIPGHEFVGVVESAAPADAAWVGRRVVGEINVGCGTCDLCVAGTKEHCDRRTVVGIRGRSGAFAEYVSVPVVNLHEVPDVVDDHAAVFVEPIAAACRIPEQVSIDRRTRIAVLGDGRMGLLTAQVLALHSPNVTVIGRHHGKLEVARRLGLQARMADAEAPETKFDIVVDVTGRPAGLQRALELVRPRGTAILKSTFHGEARIATWPIVVDEIAVLGSRCGPFDAALELLKAGRVQVAPLVSRVARLDEHAEALDDARRALKVLFTM